MSSLYGANKQYFETFYCLQEEKLTVDEDTLICNALVQSHDVFINSVKSRVTKLEVSLPLPPKISQYPLFYFKKTCTDINCAGGAAFL